MTEIIKITESTPTKLEERVARLRTELCSTSQGGVLMVELTPQGMVHTSRNIVDFTDWSQSWPQRQ